MLNFDLPVQSEIGVIKSLDDAIETAQSKRLKNYEAMQKMAKEFSDAGQEMTMEQWADISKNVLGAGGWLNTNAPSASTVEVLMAKQKKDAAIKAELLRREEFKARDSERKAVLADIHEQALAGKSAAELVEYANERYGAEYIKSHGLNFDQEQQKALFEAQKEGFDHGTKMYDTVEEAKADISKYQWMPQAKKDAAIAGAQAKQTRLEAAVMAEATKMGDIGWIGDANDKERVRGIVRTQFPNASNEFVESMITRAMNQATMTSRQALDKAQREENLAVSRQRQISAEARVADQIRVEEQERLEREKRASAYEQQFSVQERQQQVVASKYADKGKLPKGVDPAAALTIHSAMNEYIFDDPLAFEQAVLNKDTATMEKLKAQAITVADARAKAQTLSQLVTQNFRNVNEMSELMDNGLGMSDATSASIGKSIKTKRDIAAKNGYVAGEDGHWVDEPIFDPAGAPLGMGKKWVPAGGENGNANIAESAAYQADSMESGFINKVASHVRGFREAVRTNSHVGATVEEMQAAELAMVTKRVRALASGMGVSDQGFIDSMIQKILTAAGPTRAMPRTPYASERLDQRIRELRSSYSLDPQTAVRPGTSTTSPRAGAGYTPPF